MRLIKWRMGLYLEGFKEASSPAATPVLQLIFVPTQTHHGLAVDVQLLVQSLQEGWTCALLTTTRNNTVRLHRRRMWIYKLEFKCVVYSDDWVKPRKIEWQLILEVELISIKAAHTYIDTHTTGIHISAVCIVALFSPPAWQTSQPCSRRTLHWWAWWRGTHGTQGPDRGKNREVREEGLKLHDVCLWILFDCWPFWRWQGQAEQARRKVHHPWLSQTPGGENKSPRKRRCDVQTVRWIKPPE